MNETSVLSLRSWCCGASFGQHETTCPNYQPTPEKRVESGEPQSEWDRSHFVQMERSRQSKGGEPMSTNIAEYPGPYTEQMSICGMLYRNSRGQLQKCAEELGHKGKCFGPEPPEDWAEKEAREWFKREFGTTVWDEKYYDSLAALLRRVREEDAMKVQKYWESRGYSYCALAAAIRKGER